MTDVRELTPEFFYLPEFLVNLNGYNFGVRQGNGGKIDNVVLPRWAKGDPHIFIQKHREALESPYVSMHLHKWIDLIFGFKQQGEAAIEATNVFHYLSYQGAKDLDSIEDAHERLATIGIIHNFGQTPQQIFQRAHPQRDGGSSSRDGCLNAIIKDVSRSLTPLFDVRDRIATLTWLPKSERLLPSGVFQLPVPPVFDTVMRWGFSDGSVRFYTADNKKQLALYEHLHIGPPTTATFVDSRTLATAGADAVVTVWNVVHSAKNIEVSQRDSFFGHRAPVTMLVASKSLSTLISCDMKGRVLMWDLNLNVFVREIQAAGHGEVRAARISAATGDVVLCVGRVVKVFSLNGDTLLERDVCDDKDAGDYVSSCAWYEGLRGEWVEKILLFTGHRSGVTKVRPPFPLFHSLLFFLPTYLPTLHFLDLD
jgi:WD40 repeat protein